MLSRAEPGVSKIQMKCSPSSDSSARMPAATQEQYKGEVISFRKEDGGQHLVLYDDGEDEWVDVSQEEPVWQAPLHGPPACVAPGLPPGKTNSLSCLDNHLLCATSKQRRCAASYTRLSVASSGGIL